MIADPVCGKRINRGKKAHIIIEHDAVACASCCPHCQTEFERAPKGYGKPEMDERLERNQGAIPIGVCSIFNQKIEMMRHYQYGCG